MKMAREEVITLDMEGHGNDNIHEEDVVLQYMRKKLLATAGSKSSKSPKQSDRTIFKVDYEERRPDDNKLKNEDDPYNPRVISIGPLHRGKEDLEEMEEVKWRYLKNLLRNKWDDLPKYLAAARSKEEEAKRRYVRCDFKKLHPNDAFSVMLVLDGCFLMEFLRKSNPRYEEKAKRRKHLSKKRSSWGRRILPISDEKKEERRELVLNDFGWRLPWIKHDILLFENQIPFFVLEALYEVFVEDSSCPTSIKDLAIDYLYNTELLDKRRNFWALYAEKDPLKNEDIDDPSHLLHLYHTFAVETQHKPPFRIRQKIRGTIRFVTSILVNIVYLPIYYFYTLVMVKSTLYPTKISTATELEEAGVKFQGSFMDLRFRKGTLFVPVFSLNYHSFSLLKNLIALEYYHPQPIRPYIYCYAEFLTEFIESSSDLEILNNLDIIMVQNKEAGTDLIRKLLTEPELREKMMEDGSSFGYWQNPLERQKEIMKFCKNPRHRWGRRLKKDYFDSPWSVLGVLVALILLVLTVLQTIYTMLPYLYPQEEIKDWVR